MKKSIYYRACIKQNNFIFKEDTGYIINFYNGTAAVDLVFAKNQFNLWTITELTTGFLAYNETFLTRKEAINAITSDHLKKIIDQMKHPRFIEAVERLTESRAKNQA